MLSKTQKVASWQLALSLQLLGRNLGAYSPLDTATGFTGDVAGTVRSKIRNLSCFPFNCACFPLAEFNQVQLLKKSGKVIWKFLASDRSGNKFKRPLGKGNP